MAQLVFSGLPPPITLALPCIKDVPYEGKVRVHYSKTLSLMCQTSVVTVMGRFYY